MKSDKLHLSFNQFYIFNPIPKTEQEAIEHANALAKTGKYPIGTDFCFNVGISGGCDQSCFNYLNGNCPEPSVMVERLTTDYEINKHNELYS